MKPEPDLFSQPHRNLSQEDVILRFMKEGHRITAIEALQRFRCFRLASRISALKKSGHDIRREMVRVGGGKKVASYWIERRQAA